MELPLHLFESLPSTNQTLWELLDRGATADTTVIAARQTAGRGQWGRQWRSHPGGLYLSMALAPNLQASHSAQLTLCSAWGIATALRNYNIPVLIKWPNDLLLLGRKLGGILTETRVHQGQITQAVVGVGINWSNHVPESGITLQSFFQGDWGLGGITSGEKRVQPGEEILNPGVTSLEMLAAIVIQGLYLGYHCQSEEGIEVLLPSYLELLESRGRHVLVDGKPGIVQGVTPTGELRVSLNTTKALAEICLKPGTISLGYPQ